MVNLKGTASGRVKHGAFVLLAGQSNGTSSMADDEKLQRKKPLRDFVDASGLINCNCCRYSHRDCTLPEHDVATGRVLPLTFNLCANKPTNEPEIYPYSRWFYQREDPLWVHFPPYEFQLMNLGRYLPEVQKELEFAAGAHKVRIANDDHF
ncbi:hypothetical protein PG988_003136 [Apiospora saccharicola]